MYFRGRDLESGVTGLQRKSREGVNRGQERGSWGKGERVQGN